MIEAMGTSFYIWIYIFFGTVLGGLSVPIINQYLQQNHLYLTVFCGGILAGLLGFDLIPESISSYSPIGIYSGISLGIFIMLLFEKFLHGTMHSQSENKETFVLLFLSLFIHSIPTGLALGMNFEHHHFQSSSLLIAILIHHIPEGMVMMVSVMYSKRKMKLFLLLSGFLSFAVGFNTYLGMTVDLHSLKLQTMMLGVAIGSLSYVTFYEILWKGLKRNFTLKLVLGACFGVAFLRICLVFAGFSH